MKILIAVDGSAYTKRALGYLTAHDEMFGAHHEYTIFYGVLAVPHRAAAFAGQKLVRGYYDDDAESVFRPIRTFLKKQGIEATYIHKVGHPAESIAALAERGKFDLLIMGSHGHGALVNLVLGSIATKVLAHCRTPVLLIR